METIIYTDTETQVIKYFSKRYMDVSQEKNFKMGDIPSRPFISTKVVINDLLTLPNKLELKYTDILNVFKTCQYFKTIYYEKKTIDNKLHKSVLFNIVLNKSAKTLSEQLEEMTIKYSLLEDKYNSINDSTSASLREEKELRLTYQKLYDDSIKEISILKSNIKDLKHIGYENRYVRKQEILSKPITTKIVKTQEQIDDEEDERLYQLRIKEDNDTEIRHSKAIAKEAEANRKAIEKSEKALQKLKEKNRLQREKDSKRINNENESDDNDLEQKQSLEVKLIMTPEDKKEAHRLWNEEMNRKRLELESMACDNDD